MVLMFVVGIMDMFVGVHFAIVLVRMIVLIMGVTTHLDSPPDEIFCCKFYYKLFSSASSEFRAMYLEKYDSICSKFLNR